jgi:hypothetical protein
MSADDLSLIDFEVNEFSAHPAPLRTNVTVSRDINHAGSVFSPAMI